MALPLPSPVAAAVVAGDAALLGRYVATRAHDAFAALVERHLSLVRTTCQEHLGMGHPWLDDATQAVFLILARRAADIRDPQALPAWLRTTARGVAANIRKSERRRRAREQEAQDAEALQGPLQDAALAQAEVRLRLEQAIATLTPGQREAVVRHFLQDKRQAEVAQELGISTGAVKKRIADAMVTLRSLFQAEGALPSVLALAAQDDGIPPHLLDRCLQASHAPGTPRAEAVAQAMAAPTRPWAMTAAIAAVAATGMLATVLWLAGPHAPSAAAPASHARPRAMASLAPLPSRPTAPAATPAGAVLDLLAALQRNDTAAALRCLPPAAQTAIEDRWRRFAATPAAVSDALADIGLSMIAHGLSVGDVQAGYQPLTRDLYQELRRLSATLAARGATAPAALLAACARDLHGYASTLPAHDPALMTRVQQARLDTGHVWGVASMAQARQLPFPEVVRRLGAVLGSVKRWWLPYGLDVDRVLASVRVVAVQGSGSARTLTLTLTAFGHPYQTTVAVQQQGSQWVCPALEEALEESFTAISHYFYLPPELLPGPPAPVPALPEPPGPQEPPAHAPPRGHS